MKQFIATIQGKKTTIDIERIQALLDTNPSWGRTKLSEELCRLWNWRTTDGLLKDMACRTLLLKLDRAGIIRLPARKRLSTNEFRNRFITDVPHDTKPIQCSLHDVLPLTISPVLQTSTELSLFKCLLAKYHYLGFRNTVGENLKYLVRDYKDRPLACLLFGSAAWKCAPRDGFIGWGNHAHDINLRFVTNNTRFLILPWVRAPHLASHIFHESLNGSVQTGSPNTATQFTCWKPLSIVPASGAPAIRQPTGLLSGRRKAARAMTATTALKPREKISTSIH